jgi:hypothetical protein
MLADLSFATGVLAILAIAGVVIRDWRRGRTGLGSLVITREAHPDRFWYTLVLYINIGFLIMWLLQQIEFDAPKCDPALEDCVQIIIAEPTP